MSDALVITDRDREWLASSIRHNTTTCLDALAYSISSQHEWPGADEAIEKCYEQLEWLTEFADRCDVPRPDIAYRMKNIEALARRKEKTA